MKSNISTQSVKRSFLQTGFFILISLVMIGFQFNDLHAQRRIMADEGEKVDHKTQAAIIDTVTRALNDIYVFPDVAKEMEKQVRKNYKSRKYKDVTSLFDFTMELTNDLRSVSQDRHLTVLVLPDGPGDQTRRSPEEEQRLQLERLRRDNFGFKKIELLQGNIGYVDFRYFAEADFAGATAVAAMNFLSNADALIFDMRQNGGGNPSMIQLISSYLFEESVHLNSFYVRRTDEIQQFWTQANVQGPKMTDIPVYVLTSSFTFSGAEEFTYNLKNMKRATIIGETTGGGAHPVNRHTYENLGIALNLPFGRAINPITGTNWEGVGVEPDIKVPADEALIVARIEATKQLTEYTQDEMLKRQYEWSLTGLEAERNPVHLSNDALEVYAGTYGPRKIWVEDGSLYYQREDRPKSRLTPMGNDTFFLEGLDFFRIKFNKDESGKTTELIGLYNDGRSDKNKRDDES